MLWPRLLVITVLCLFAATSSVVAQTSTRTISGTVLDSAGAVMPAVEVSVKNLDTGLTRALSTNERGRYMAPQLPLGNYEVSARAAGFQTEVRRGITIAVGREAVVDFPSMSGPLRRE